jgi:uncharacterized membrane protein
MKNQLGKIEFIQLFLTIAFFIYVVFIILGERGVLQFNIFNWFIHVGVMCVFVMCILIYLHFSRKHISSYLIAALGVGVVAFSIGLGIGITSGLYTLTA